MIPNNKVNIEILSLSVLPYCPSSRAATEFPAFGLFSNRTQFIPFARQSHVAVKIKTRNLTFGNSRSRKSRKTFFVNVRDLATDVVVASRTLCVEMSHDEQFRTLRIDIPFRRSQLNPDHDYSVEVAVPGSDVVLAAHPLSYVSVQMLPTRYYSPVSAYVEAAVASGDGDDVAEIRFVSISSLAKGRSVVFLLENNVAQLARLPELFISFVSRDGRSVMLPCSLVPHESGGVRYVKASCPLPEEIDIDSYLYVELFSMGYHFTGALFDASAGYDEEGELYAEELGVISNLTVEKVRNVLEARRLDRSNSSSETGRPHMSPLDSLVGLKSVKAKLESCRKLMDFYRLRREAGLPALSTPLHCLFLGSPGTGKTTVAKELGRVMHECGALSSGHVVIRERASLLGQYYNSESEKTLAAIKEAQGGILFIDEAYQLHQPSDPKDPGRFVLETLMTALADTSKRDWMLILAGYTEPMLAMFSLNPGLASRIPESNFYKFDDFTEEELMEIATRYLSSKRFVLSDSAHEALSRRLSSDYASRKSDFGNARHVVNLIETEVIPAMAMRVSEIKSPSRSELVEIQPSDIPSPAIVRIPPRRIGFAC